MKNKKIQFIPGDTEAMAEYAVAQYSKLLTGYDTFQIDDEALDSAIEELVPQRIRSAVTDAIGCASWGCRPLLESGMLTEEMLQKIIARLDAVVEYAEDGEEFTIWNNFRTNKAGKVMVVNG
jgi:hypothetical protein